MADDKSELSSLQERLKAMREAQKAEQLAEANKVTEPDAPKPAKKPPAPKKNPTPAEKTPDEPDDAAARIRKRLEKNAESETPKPEPKPKPEPEPKPEKLEEKSPQEPSENPADRLRALLEKHRRDNEKATEDSPPAAPPQPAPKPTPKEEPKPEKEIEEPNPEPVFVPAPAPVFSQAAPFRPIAEPSQAVAATRPRLRYRLRLRWDKMKKTRMGKVVSRFLSLVVRLCVAASLIGLVIISLGLMAGQYCSMNDLVVAYCQNGLAPMTACQTDYGTFDAADMRYWQQLQNYYDYGFVLPWIYVYIMGGHAVAAIVLGLMGLYHGPRIYRKILRFFTFPLRKIGLLKRL